jgi:hypothetical protein
MRKKCDFTLKVIQVKNLNTYTPFNWVLLVFIIELLQLFNSQRIIQQSNKLMKRLPKEVSS